MILCSFQGVDWKEWNNKRYSDFKKYLNVPEDKNIYWFFSGRTLAEAITNAFTVTANTPACFVMADVSNFVRIDKIKWLQYCEREHESLTKEEWDDLTKIENEAAVEYIVVGVPEKYIEMRMDFADFEEILHKAQVLADKGNIVPMRAFAVFCSDKVINAYERTMESLCDAKFEYMNSEGVNISKGAMEQIAEMKRACIAYISTFFYGAYVLGLTFICDNGDEISEGFEGFHCNMIQPMTATRFATDYALFSMSVPNKEYAVACQELLSLQKRILKEIFELNSLIKQPPNERCLCGSGKKFKKCCGRGVEFDVQKIMTCDNEEYDKLKKWSNQTSLYYENFQKK